MISYLSTVNIYVTNQDESLRFFRDQLEFVVIEDSIFPNGFRRITVSPHRTSQTKLMLYKTTPQMNEYQYIGQWTGLTFYTDDIHKTYQEYKNHNVEFTQEPIQQPFGEVATQFTDPDGNLYDLIQTPLQAS
jgi:lactoylglutathione lyase